MFSWLEEALLFLLVDCRTCYEFCTYLSTLCVGCSWLIVTGFVGAPLCFLCWVHYRTQGTSGPTEIRATGSVLREGPQSCVDSPVISDLHKSDSAYKAVLPLPPGPPSSCWLPQSEKVDIVWGDPFQLSTRTFQKIEELNPHVVIISLCRCISKCFQ